MAVHLTRIYTRTGDDGTTGLSDFSRVSKNDARLVAYADCDEANSALGVAIALGITAIVAGADVVAWWILPVAVALLLGYSVWRAARGRTT